MVRQYCAQRLRLYAVRDCGAVTYPPTQNLMRATMFELPLKLLLHIAFVSRSVFIFSVIFSVNLLLRFGLPCVGKDTLFDKLWL